MIEFANDSIQREDKQSESGLLLSDLVIVVSLI